MGRSVLWRQLRPSHLPHPWHLGGRPHLAERRWIQAGRRDQQDRLGLERRALRVLPDDL